MPKSFVQLRQSNARFRVGPLLVKPDQGQGFRTLVPHNHEVSRRARQTRTLRTSLSPDPPGHSIPLYCIMLYSIQYTILYYIILCYTIFSPPTPLSSCADTQQTATGSVRSPGTRPGRPRVGPGRSVSPARLVIGWPIRCSRSCF